MNKGVKTVREICKDKGISVSQLEKDLGFGNGYLNPKKLNTIPVDRALAIAEYLQCDVGLLLEDYQSKRTIRPNFGEFAEGVRAIMADRVSGNDNVGRVPVVRRVAAGLPLDSIDEVLGYEQISNRLAKTGEYFGLKIKGDSMMPGIADGDIVICHKQPDAEDGQIVVALVDGNDGTCKRLKKYPDGTIALMSDNTAYPPMYFNTSEIDNVPIRIMGVVKELRRKF